MGRLIQQDDPNGVVDQYTYNNMNELTQDTETGAGNSPIAEYDYTYRADGKVATETDDFWFANNGQNVEVTNTIMYSYDALDRLTDEAFSTTAEQILGYDSNLPSNVQQWESFNDEYFYDLDSNMVGEVTQEQNGTTETTASTYDANDRLVQQVKTISGGTNGSSTTTTEYTYNDTGQEKGDRRIY
jgi:YD repeat-containing protein